MTIISQMQSSKNREILLYFNKKYIHKEAASNLVTIVKEKDIISDELSLKIVELLSEILDKICQQIKTRYPDEKAIFYAWLDTQANALRWTVISDMGQTTLPFCSAINETSLEQIIEKWFSVKAPECDVLSDDEIRSQLEELTMDEWQKIMSSRSEPSLDVFIQKLH